MKLYYSVPLGGDRWALITQKSFLFGLIVITKRVTTYRAEDRADATRLAASHIMRQQQ